MYRGAAGVTDYFKVKLRLHQGLALSPFVFAVVMDRLTDNMRREAPQKRMFADNIVLYSEKKEMLR